jgi:hypothetical protein
MIKIVRYFSLKNANYSINHEESSMKRMLLAGLFLAVGGFASAASAQTSHVINLQVVEVVAIGLNDGTAIALQTQPPIVPGDPPIGQSDSTKYLRYTTVNAAGLNRNVTAQMSVAAPSGTRLDLAAAPVAGQGTTAGTVTLNNLTATSVITGIGSCYTGVLATSGAQLTYSLVVVNTTLLAVAAAVPVTITLTLTDAS